MNTFQKLIFSVIFIFSLFQNDTFAINNSVNDIFIVNGVQLDFRNIEKEKEYFKSNNQKFSEFIGVPFKKNDKIFIPLKKTMDLSNVQYTINDDNIIFYLDDKNIDFNIKSNECNIYDSKQNLILSYKLEDKLIFKFGNMYYVNLEFFKYLGFNVIRKSGLIYINGPNINIEVFNDSKYRELIDMINDDRKSVDNTNKIDSFINNVMLPKTMLLVSNDKDMKVSIPKGKYLENFHYGKMILLLNGKVLGNGALLRKKEKDMLSYYLKKDNQYISSQVNLEIADEIVIYCPYCKSSCVIKIKNPFRYCDCK